VRGFIFHLNELYQKGSTLKILDELLRNETLSRKQIEEIQWEKLEKLIRYAYDSVPYYRKMWQGIGLRPRDIHNFDDFTDKIPIISKTDVRNHFNEFISEKPNPGVYLVETSGTTGYPVTFLRDGVARSFTMAGRFRGRSWWGVNPIDTEVRFWGRTSQFTPSIKIKFRDKIKRFKDWMVGIHYCSSFHMSEMDIEKYSHIIQRTKPRIIFGFPSALFIFSKFMKDRGRNFLDSEIKLLNYTAEPFYTSQKKIVQEIFGSRIASEYGSVENGVIAFQCPKGSLHVMDEDIYLESFKIGNEEKQLVTTNLNAYAFPLIRYATDDIGTISDETCSCGRPLKVMKLKQGRSFDNFRKPSGEYVVGAHIDDAIYLPLIDLKGCRRYRAVQREPDRVEILLEAVSPVPKKVVEEIHQNLYELMGEGVKIEIHHVDQLAVEKSGKFKCIISYLTSNR